MAAVQNLLRLVWGGSLCTKEQWSCSLHIGSPTLTGLGAETFQPAVEAYVTNPASLFANFSELDFIKFNRIDPVTGRYFDPATSETLEGLTVGGALTQGAPQVALVVATRTAKARGRAHAGRWFVPCGQPAGGIDSDGLITLTAASGAAFAAATFLTAVNALIADGGPVVFSKIAQTVEPITHVSVGRVLDTMRSRRTSLVEQPSESPVT